MNRSEHLAHITTLSGKRVEQTIKSHSFKVAEYAGESLKSIGLYFTAYLAGLLHDMGKCKDEWNDYIEKAYCGENPIRGSINHTFAAVKYLIEHYDIDGADRFQRLTCEIIAVAVGSHHGLFDLEDPSSIKKEGGIRHRVETSDEKIGYKEAVSNFFVEVADKQQIDSYFEKAVLEIKNIVQRMITSYDGKSGPLLFGYVVRLITSAVIEGDRRDTAEFLNGVEFSFDNVNQKFWQEQLEFMEEKISHFDTDTPLNIARTDISNQCRNFAKRKGGIYRLTVPTGGGKTLASLRYALAHAAEYDKSRVIFIIPLLSVLDQNSKEFHKYIKDSQVIFEHHSNIIKTSDDAEELDKRELLEDTWDSPVIVSTLVQLLNICFSDKTAAVRRMKSLCNNILIIDEVQSMPTEYMSLFNMMANFLAEFCKTTIILCSATQPALEELQWGIHFEENAEMVSMTPSMKEVFKRVKIVNKIEPYGMSIEELVDFIQENIEQKDSVLVICNTKRNARDIYRQLALIDNEYELYHLSTSMCKAHREDVLNKIGKTPGLDTHRKVICIATQLVEAGIDFSFECVIRISAGIDSIAQAAGRCNRNNDWNKICESYIVKLKSNEENLSHLKDIKIAQDCCQEVLYQIQLKEDILSETAIKKYFESFFRKEDVQKSLNYPVKINGHNCSITNMLSTNIRADNPEPYILHQAFKTAGQNCKVFDNEKNDVIVRYNGENDELITNLYSEKSQKEFQYLKEQIEKLKPYSVGLFDYELEKLKEDGMIEEFADMGIIILDKSAYDDRLGVTLGEYNVKDDFSMA